MQDRSNKPQQATRHSCDRCYSHKLRCSRPQLDDSVSCARCSSLGTQCVYSPPLPKGRPSGGRKNAGSISKKVTLLPLPHESATSGPGTGIKPNTDTNTETSTGSYTRPGPGPGPGSGTGNDNVSMEVLHTREFEELWSALQLPNASPDVASWFATDPLAWAGTADYIWQPFPDVAAAMATSNPDSENVFTKSMSELAALSVELCALHRTSRAAQASLEEQQPHLVAHSNTFSSVAAMLVELPDLRDRDIFSEACLASKRLLHIMHALRLFDSPKGRAYAPNSAGLLDSCMSDSAASASSTSHSTPQYMSSASGSSVDMDMDGPNPSYETDSATRDESTMQALRHLLSACYVQLLHVHTVLVSLMLQEASIPPELDISSPFSFARLRLVVISNLLTHLLDSMRRGFASYGVSTRSATRLPPLEEEQPAAYAGSHEIDQLESQLWKDLEMLKACLSPGIPALSAD